VTPVAATGALDPPGYTSSIVSMTEMPSRAVRPVGASGSVMLIGGAEDKVRDKVILSRFAEAAGGVDAHVVVI
jgi:cyanophycinase-like exopeptidase